MMTNNNFSRKVAKGISSFGLVKENQRNVFLIDGLKMCFSVSWKPNAVCRQFYDDCDGVIVLNANNNCLYKFSRCDGATDHSPNRISPKTGVLSRTFTSDYENGVEFAYIDIDSNNNVIEFVSNY